MYYAGIGSRETPPAALSLITVIALKMEQRGWILRSGGATGADSAFEAGVKNPEHMEIFLPGSYFNGRYAQGIGTIDATKLDSYPKALKSVNLFHPAPGKLTNFGKKLMARNAMQVLGHDMLTPSKVVIAWTKDGKMVGGTSQALRMARFNNIPVLNLGSSDVYEGLKSWVEGKVAGGFGDSWQSGLLDQDLAEQVV